MQKPQHGYNSYKMNAKATTQGKHRHFWLLAFNTFIMLFNLIIKDNYSSDKKKDFLCPLHGLVLL